MEQNVQLGNWISNNMDEIDDLDEILNSEDLLKVDNSLLPDLCDVNFEDSDLNIDMLDQYTHSSNSIQEIDTGINVLPSPNQNILNSEQNINIAQKVIVNKNVSTSNVYKTTILPKNINVSPVVQSPTQKVLLSKSINDHKHILLDQDQVQEISSSGYLPKSNSNNIKLLPNNPPINISALSHQNKVNLNAVGSTLIYKALPAVTLSSTSGVHTLVSNGNQTILTSGIPLILEPDKLPTISSFSPNNMECNENKKSDKRPTYNHNAIEKRYRSSINDRIVELKTILAGENSKMSKSEILRKTVDYIRHLQNQNMKLKRENMALKMEIEESLVMKQNRDRVSIMTPPHTDSDSAHSPESVNDDGQISLHDRFAIPNLQTQLNERSRFAVCMIMLSAIFFNPFGTIYKSTLSESYDSAIPGRSMLDAGDNSWNLNTFWNSSLLFGLINVFLIFCCMIKLYFYMDTIIEEKSKEYQVYWRHSKQADEYLNSNNFELADRNLRIALSALKKNVPASPFDIFCSLLWNIIQQLLYRIWIGKIFSHRLGNFMYPNTIFLLKKQLADASKLYNLLNQLHLTKKGNFSRKEGLIYHMEGINLSLLALNHAEFSLEYVKDEDMMDIYINSALRAKQSYTKSFQFFQRYYLYKARIIFQNCSELMKFKWLFTPSGYSFFLTQNWSYNKTNSILSQVTSPGKPITYASEAYRFNFLKDALNIILTPGSKFEAFDSVRKSQVSDALTLIDSVLGVIQAESTQEYNMIGSSVISIDQCKDDVCKWWAALFGVAAYWLNGKETKAAELYNIIESVPKEYQNKDGISSCIYHAFKARKHWLSVSNTSAVGTTLNYCNKASATLEETWDSCSHETMDPIFYNLVLLACEWQLETRTMIWQADRCSNTFARSAPLHTLNGFQKDLGILRSLSEALPYVLSRVFLHEATLRMMAGAAPGKTQQLLDRSLRNKTASRSLICGKDKNIVNISGEREHAKALYMACEYLPLSLLSSREERAGMLIEAARTLEKIGDVHKMQHCYKLMKKFGVSHQI